MRPTWLFTTIAALGLVMTASDTVAAGPVAMTRGVRPVASTTAGSWTDKLKFWKKDAQASSRVTAVPAKPTEEISPWRHPITYFSAVVSESPVAAAIKGDKTTEQAADSIGLNTPTGPATPQFYIAVAQMAEQQGNADEARGQLQKGLAKWPTDVALLRAAARLEDRQGKLPLAETLYRRAVAANPQDAGALNDLGLCLARQGKLEQSVQSIEQAINIQPTKALYRNNAATVLVEMHQDQRALAHLSAVHGPAESNYNLGQLLVDRNRPHEAIAFFQRALELDPTMQQAQLAIAQLNGMPTIPSQYAVEPVTPQQEIAPAYGPQFAPQQQVAEPTIPATARGPAFGTSSYIPATNYVPPTNYYPSSPLPQYAAPQTPVYQTATAPRYLPPVRQVPPGTMVR